MVILMLSRRTSLYPALSCSLISTLTFVYPLKYNRYSIHAPIFPKVSQIIIPLRRNTCSLSDSTTGHEVSTSGFRFDGSESHDSTDVSFLLKRAGASGHIPLSHTLWSQIVKKNDVVVDATCGNGHDSLFLAKLSLTPTGGTVHCIDLQHEAIKATTAKLQRELDNNLFQRVDFHHRNHCDFPPKILSGSVKLVVYNLGYLPGGSDKETVTTPENTIISIQNALKLLCRYGLISITCYRGHTGGPEECLAVENYLSCLEEEKWRVFSHSPLNRPMAPVLYTIFKVI